MTLVTGLFLLLFCSFPPTLLTADDTLPVLTNIQQVLALGQVGALTSPHPVHVTAVVTFTSEGPDQWHIVHDGTGGCVVRATNAVSLRLKQRVEVQGQVTPANFYPYIGKAALRIVGDGDFPEPAIVPASQLNTGAQHAGWVRLKASVLDMVSGDNKATYLVSSAGTTFNVNISEFVESSPFEHLNATLEFEVELLDIL